MSDNITYWQGLSRFRQMSDFPLVCKVISASEDVERVEKIAEGF